MKKVTYGTVQLLNAIGRLSQAAHATVKMSTHPIRDTKYNASHYGIGYVWWIHIVKENAEAIIRIALNASPALSGIAKATLRRGDQHEQVVITLDPASDRGMYQDVHDVWEWLWKQAGEPDLFATEAHEKTKALFEKDTVLPKVTCVCTPKTAQGSDNCVIDLIFKSDEYHDKVVFVFSVTSLRGRFDTYSAVVLNNPFLLRNLMGLYRKRLFNKFMRLLQNEASTEDGVPGVMLHKVTGKNVLVCTQVPTTGLVADTRFEPGSTYVLKSSDTNMDNDTYYTIEVAGVDVVHHSRFFLEVIDRRPEDVA